MTVKELIEALQKLPPEADVYYYEGGCDECGDSESDPGILEFKKAEDCGIRADTGKLAYPHGRVRL